MRTMDKTTLLQFNDTELNLEIMAEECAEILQAKSKGFRFGFHDHHPETGITNHAQLETEIGQLQAMIDILVTTGFLDQEKLREAKLNKIKKLEKWYKVDGCPSVFERRGQ